jgi:DNA-binding transcriptional MerR regulator
MRDPVQRNVPPRPGGGGTAAEGPGPKAEPSGVTGTMSIGEVLGILKPEFPDITVSKIRFLEGAGLVQPDRSASGYRKFSEDDVARLRFVLRAQRDQYLPLRVIRQRLADLEEVGGLAAKGAPATEPGMGTDPDAHGARAPGATAGGAAPGAAAGRAAPGTAAGGAAPGAAVGSVAPGAGQGGAAPGAVPGGPVPGEAPGDQAASGGPVPGGAPGGQAASSGSVPAAGRGAAQGVADAEGAAGAGGAAAAGAVAGAGGAAGAAAAGGQPARPGGGVFGAAPPSDAQFTRDELCRAAGATVEQLLELESFGLVSARGSGERGAWYGGDDLVLLRLARELGDYGLEARHLRMYKLFAEREAALFEQVVAPLVRQRNPEARARARDTIDALAELGGRMRDLALRTAVHGMADTRDPHR